MPPRPDVDQRCRASIVIPVYDQVFYTRVCLASLEYEQNGAEVIIVDNCSTDGTSSLLNEWEDPSRRRRSLRLKRNMGFGPACNAGAKLANGEFIVFLNNDTFVLPGWLSNLLRPFADASIQVTGARLLYPNGHIQHAGVAFNEAGPWHVFVGLPADSPAVLEQRDYQVVTGASLAIRTAEFQRLGGFDTAFMNAFEDVDLCLRVRNDGGRVVYVPDSTAYHFEAMTEGRTGATDSRSYEVFMARWLGRFECDVEQIQQRARAAGHNLERRAPSRRELMESEANAAAQLAELHELRRLAATRSVRTALWMRQIYRKLVPRLEN